MKKFMKKAVKGFTLVELIIAIALMSVLMVMVGLIMKPISQVFADTTSYTEDRYVMDGIGQFLDENLKYADNILVVYNKEYYPIQNPTSDYEVSDDGNIESKLNVDYPLMTDAEKEAYCKRIQAIAIINDVDPFGAGGLGQEYKNEHFINNSGDKQLGRIYKSAYIPSKGERDTWLVGGEAFYGEGSYFINLEGTEEDGTNDGNDHFASKFPYDANGDGSIDASEYTIYGLKYTIYSLNPKEYSRSDYATNLAAIATFKGKTREEMKTSANNDLIQNYAEKFIAFKNKPFDNQKLGVKSPANADIGRDITTEAENVNNDPAFPSGADPIIGVPATPGYNIYIYYTVPE